MNITYVLAENLHQAGLFNALIMEGQDYKEALSTAKREFYRNLDYFLDIECRIQDVNDNLSRLNFFREKNWLSPTCLQHMRRYYKNVEKRVIKIAAAPELLVRQYEPHYHQYDSELTELSPLHS